MLAGTFSAAPSVSDTPFGKPGPSGLTEVTALQVTEVSVEYSRQSVWVFFFFFLFYFLLYFLLFLFVLNFISYLILEYS